LARLNYQLPHRMFIHFTNCPDYRPFHDPRFPNFAFCPHCSSRLLGMKFGISAQRLIPNYFWNNLLTRTTVDIQVSYSAYKGRMNCLRNYWTAQDLKAKQGNRCTLTDFIIQNLMAVQNSSFQYILGTSGEKWNMYGIVNIDLHFNEFKMEVTNSLAYFDTSEYVLLYCNFEVKSEQMLFSAWWSPFRVNVWVWFILSTILTSLTLILYTERNYRNIIQWLFVTIQTVLRQEDGRREGLLLLFSFTSMVITCLYENTITSALIAPTDPRIIENMIQLIDEGYKVVYHKSRMYDINETEVEEAVFIRPYEIRNLTHKFSMENFIPEFNDFFNSSSVGVSVYGNPDKKRAMFFQSRATVVEDYFGRLRRSIKKYSCYRVKESIGETFDFILMHVSKVQGYKETISKFKEAGLLVLWERLGKLQRMYARNSRFEAGNFGSEIQVISLPNLVPVFSVWAALLICSVLSCLIH